ncbi:MAG: DUF4340 domain-containing protein [Clostridiales bacterium]|nr:DUF4340 domain-containing protein [Clostridiales bacterium]
MAKRKKKNQLTLISLLLALVLLTGFYVWFSNKDKFGVGNKADEDKDLTGEDSSLILADIDLDLVDTIRFINEDSEVTLVLEEDLWKSKADKDRPINQNVVSNMLSLIDEVKAERLVNESPEDIEQYGLTKPDLYIEVMQSDKKLIGISLGYQVASSQGYYAKIEGNDGVYVLPNTYKTYFAYSEREMTDIGDGLAIESSSIYHVQVLQQDGEDFELIYDPDSTYHKHLSEMFSWLILKPYDEIYAADNAKVTEFLPNYDSFNFISCIEYQAKEFDKYGLDEPKASILIEYYQEVIKPLDEPTTDPDTGEEVTEEIITVERSYMIYVGDQDEQGDYYVRKEGSQAVYTMKAKDIDKMLNVDAFSIFNPFVNLHNILTVDRIDIEINGNPYSMVIDRETIINDDGEEEVVEEYYYNGNPADIEAFKDVYQIMISAKYDTQLKEEVSTEGLEPVLTMSYKINTGETYTSRYFPYDDSLYIIDNGINNSGRFASDKRIIDGIIEAIIEFKRTDE